MENYYEILEISPSASEEEIRKALFQAYRKWSNRTNAPQLERRQEAERIVKLLQDVEEVLLNPQKRALYDRQLQGGESLKPDTEPAIHPEPVTEIESTVVDDGVEKGWLLLQEGKLTEAFSLVSTITEKNDDNAEAWSLLAEIYLRQNKLEHAIKASQQAIQIVPTHASGYALLGRILEHGKRLEEAVEQFEKAWKLEPTSLDYCGSVGILLVKTEQYAKALSPLEKCIENETDPKKNSTYQWYLAFAYHRLAYTNWLEISEGHPHVDAGLYATEKKHIQEARTYLDRALGLSFDDPQLSANLNSCKQDLQRLSSRQFMGNWLLPSINAAIGILAISLDSIINVRFSTIGGILMLLVSILYVIFAFSPLYSINRRLINGGSRWDWMNEQWNSRRMVVGLVGLLGIIVTFPFIQIILPLFIMILTIINADHNDWIKWMHLLGKERSKESVNKVQ